MRCCCGRVNWWETELEEQGKDLMTYVKETYQYQSDRVSRVLCDVNGEEE